MQHREGDCDTGVATSSIKTAFLQRIEVKLEGRCDGTKPGLGWG
jgi:hypothetical protein